MRDIGAAKSDNAKMGNSALSQDICLPVLASEHGLRCGLLYIHCGLQIVSGMAITLSNSPLCVCTYTPHVYFPEMCYKMAIVPVAQQETFEGENFCKFWGFVAICKIFSAKFGGVASFAGTSEQYTVIVLVAYMEPVPQVPRPWDQCWKQNLWISLRAGCRSSDSAIIFHT